MKVGEKIYSYEIQSYFNNKNYTLENYAEFQHIKDESPQINRIRFEQWLTPASKYYVTTSDGHEWFIYIKNYQE